jgi:unspecific monooxygenase
MVETNSFAPPLPAVLPENLPWWRSLIAFRQNVIATWPPSAYEDEIRVGGFFGRRWLLVNSPEVIRRVLVDNDRNYRRTRAGIRILRPIVGRGLLLATGEDWKAQRRTVAPAFAPRTLPVLTRHVAAVAREGVPLLGRVPGAPVDLFAAMQHLALEIAGRSMFSLEMAQHGTRLRAMLTRYSERLGRPYMLDLLLPTGVPTPHDLARAWFRWRWMGLIERLMAARAAASRSDAPRDLYDLLVGARDPEGGAAFTPAALRDQVATLLVAGHETTAVALFWALYLLAGAPDVQERLAAEVKDLALDEDAAVETLPKLVYTRAVLSEALRLYPPAFALAREAIGADRVGEVEIPPRAVILIAPWVLHRHRRFWRDPDRFDPSRFLPDAPPVDRFAYLPFGAGPRVCVGAQFALTEATLVLAALVKAWRITVDAGPPVLPLAVVTTRPDHAPSFRLAPR